MSCPSCVHCRALETAASEMCDLDLAIHILQVLSERYHIKADTIRSPDRAQHVAFVRMVGMYLTRKLTKWTYPAIAEFYQRDHSTVISAWNKIARLQLERPMFRQELERLVAEIQAEPAAKAVA